MILKIETTKALELFCADLKKQPFIAVDTEFVRQKTYRAILCLVQIAAPDGSCACVDPLAKDMDLTPLLDIMKDTNILKVFHSARQDLEIFYDLMNDLPKPLFDTQVGAMVCGLGDSISYHGVVCHYLGLDLDKSLRATDWSARPLTQKQLEYALADVTHLVHVYEKMQQELNKKGRATWVEDEMKALLDPALYEVRPQEMWLRLKPVSTKPRYLAVLKALCAWREEQAVALNRPRRHILRDEVILDLAALAPACEKDLEHIRSKKELSIRGGALKEIIALIRQTLQTPEEEMPHLVREKTLTPAEQTIKEMLRLLLNLVSAQVGVAPKVIATPEDLDKIARGNEKDVPAMQGWRFDIFGKKAMAFKEGHLMMFFDPKAKEIVFEKH